MRMSKSFRSRSRWARPASGAVLGLVLSVDRKSVV